MKCPYCAGAMIQRVSATETKLRLSGPITLNPQQNRLRSQCYWCAKPVSLQAFIPEVQPEVFKP